MDFETWWNETGSGILPLPGADMEEHGKLVAGEAWDAAIRGFLEGGNMGNWQPIDTAPRPAGLPKDALPDYQPRTELGKRLLALRQAYVASGGRLLSGEALEEEDSLDVPPSWTDGVCWARNEDGEPSVQPTHWRPIK